MSDRPRRDAAIAKLRAITGVPVIHSALPVRSDELVEDVDVAYARGQVEGILQARQIGSHALLQAISDRLASAVPGADDIALDIAFAPDGSAALKFHSFRRAR